MLNKIFKTKKYLIRKKLKNKKNKTKKKYYLMLKL
tara:strand:+ start:183 stop:287 length:105 start_codon:yes stop_codon:yes gene_type:complete